MTGGEVLNDGGLGATYDMMIASRGAAERPKICMMSSNDRDPLMAVAPDGRPQPFYACHLQVQVLCKAANI